MKTKIENKKVGRRFTYTILLLVVATSQLGGSCDVKKKVVSEVWVKVTHATDDAERLMDLDKIKKLQIFAKSSTTPLILDPTSPACQKTNYAPPNQAYDGFTSECIDTDFNGETDFSVQFHSNPLRGGNDFGFPLRNDSTDSIPFGLTVRLQGDKTDTLQTLSAITCDSGAPIHFSRELCVVTFNFKCEPGVTCKIVPKKPLIPPLEARRFWVGIESRIVVAPYDLNGDTDLPVTALMKGANDGALRPLSDFGAKLVLSEQLSPSPGPPMWNFIWTPTNDHLVATPYEVQFRVSDPSNLFSTTSVAITIEENASPWFPRPFGRQQLRANDELTVRFPLPTDPEDQDVEVSIDWNSSRLPPTAAQTDLSVERINFEWVFKWKTKFGQENENEWQVVFALNDGYNVAKEIGLVKIDKVSQPPRCPAVTSDGFTMGIADETLLSFQGSDPDGDTIQYSADFRELLKYATVQAGPTRYQRLVKAIPGKFAALSTVDIPVPLTLFDGTAQVSCNFTLTINAVNPPPACPSIADKSVHAFETVVIDFEATDPNGDTLVVTTDRGTYDAAAKRVTWTPNATFVRDEAWIVKVTADDGTSKCSSEARVTVLAAEGAANGEACTASQSCASRECVAGICCATACDAATSTCATGTCKLNVGQTCTVPSVCASGKCYQAKCCQATTCAVAGKNCGTIDDGCGGVLNCGSCGAGQLCVANVCGCTPESDGDFCARVGATCGSKTGTDNCGASRTVTSCGSCTSPETCLSNVCACTPTTCTAQGKNCGSISDGCGGTLNCGTCSGTGQSCVSNVCSCTPDNTTACAGKNCGSVTNNCGQTVSCGTCSGTGESCVSNVCSCTPTTCAAQGKNCGSISDGCGGTLSCGTCAPASCTGLTRTFATSCAANVCTAPTPATENCDDGNATTGDYCAASGCIHVAAPTTAPDLDATSDTGTSPTDNITNDTTPTVIGTVAASTLVRIYEGTTLLGSVTSNATTGAYSITTSALADGTHTLVARIVDAAGNESTNSPSLSVTIDTTAPLQPGTPTLSVAAINSTGSSTVSWTAATDTGGSGIRRYYLERNFNGTGFAEIATPTSPSYTQSGTGLTGGSYTYRVLAEDNAGNLGATYSSPSAALTVITLNAITPAMANTGDTITLEGVFGSSATVNFPGATASATMQGTGSIRYRATVLVPAAATAGDLNVTTAGASTDALPFRRVSFTLGAQPPRPHYEQTGYAQQMRGLSPARRGHCNVVVPRGPANTFVYVMGGIAASSLTTVERARVNADGSLGSFGTIAGVSLVTRRYGFACAVIGDYIYVFGGYDGSSPLRSIERAPIDANGLITTFVTVPTGESQLTIARWLHSIVVVGTNIYVIGGQTTGGTDRSDVEAATINADGTIGNFAASTAALTATNRSHAAVVADNYVYILGGYKAGTVSRAIERASIGGTGSLGSFTAITTTLVTGRAMHTATIVGDKLLVVGGRVQSTDVIDSIEQSTIATNGNVGTFSVVQNLDSAREWHTAVVAGNHLYVVGGALTSGYTGAVERLEANSAGSISALSATSGAVLATPRDSHCAIVVGDSIYVIGRRTYSGSLTSGTQVTERAIVAANGTFGNFASFSGANLSSGRYRHACAIAGNYVYAIGGATGSGGTKLTTIERATIGTDGTLGGFTGISIALAVGREGHRAFFAGRRLYIVGGNVSSGSSTTIEYADVDATGALPASGTFTISGRTLSRNRYLPAVAVIGGTVNVMGGANGTAQELYVDQATIDTAGTALGAFTHNTAISINTGGFGRVAAFAGGALYVLGGGAAFTSRLNPTPTYNRREVATVNATNTLGDFVSEADDAAHNLLTPRFAAAPIVINNTLYIIGGYNDGSSPDQLSSIEQATLQ